MKLFLSPHNDDETLFGAFTIQQHQPYVVVVFDSFLQPSRGAQGCGAVARRLETVNALDALGQQDHSRAFLGLRDDRDAAEDKIRAELELFRTLRESSRHPERIEHVWIPAWEENGHEHHNLVGRVASDVFHDISRTSYLTYTTQGKSRSASEVRPRSGEEIARKLRALACYTSQLQLDDRLGCWPHFVNDLREYTL